MDSELLAIKAVIGIALIGVTPIAGLDQLTHVPR